MNDRFDELTIERTVNAPIESVWTAWTTEAGLATWWWSGWHDTAHDVTPIVGGSDEITVPSIGIGVSGEFLTSTPPHHVEMTWIWEDDDGTGPIEHVTVDLSSDGASTTVRVHHNGPWPTADAGADYLRGSNDVLDTLAETTRSDQAYARVDGRSRVTGIGGR